MVRLAATTPDTYMTGMLTDVKERRERQAQEGKAAWDEYQAQADATRAKLERLRAQRLARLAAETTTTPPKKKGRYLTAARRFA